MKVVAAQTLWVVAAVIACAVVFYGLLGWVILQGYRWLKRKAQASQQAALEGLKLHDGPAPGLVEVVFHTYYGFIAFTHETKHHLIRPESPIHGAAISPHGAIAVIIARINTIRIFNTRSGEPIFELLHPGKVMGAAIRPDGTTIAGQWVGGVRLWSDSSGKLLAELRGRGAEPCFAIAFSPDSKAILTGGPNGVVQSWEVGTGRPPGEAITYYTTVFAVAFSPDGRVVLTGGNDNTARLWDSATGKPMGRPMEHDATVYDLAFSADGKMIVTGSRDQTAGLWDAATGKPLGPPLPHAGPVRGVVFWRGGSTILTGYGPIGSTDLSPLTGLLARSWPVPTPISGDPDRLELHAQVITGLELQSDCGVKVLDAGVWQERLRRLAEDKVRAPQ